MSLRAVGDMDGVDEVGTAVGSVLVGDTLELTDGDELDGADVGTGVGTAVGAALVGFAVGERVGDAVGRLPPPHVQQLRVLGSPIVERDRGERKSGVRVERQQEWHWAKCRRGVLGFGTDGQVVPGAWGPVPGVGIRSWSD